MNIENYKLKIVDFSWMAYELMEQNGIKTEIIIKEEDLNEMLALEMKNIMDVFCEAKEKIHNEIE